MIFLSYWYDFFSGFIFSVFLLVEADHPVLAEPERWIQGSEGKENNSHQQHVKKDV